MVLFHYLTRDSIVVSENQEGNCSERIESVNFVKFRRNLKIEEAIKYVFYVFTINSAFNEPKFV